MAIKPFNIHISDTALQDLKHRLSTMRWPDEGKDAGWSDGTNLTYMKELVDYWLHTYDWRTHEAKLNALPQFTAAIDDVKVHFVYEKSDQENAPALLLSHGWPDSFYRFHKVIPLLKKHFNVVVPSIPGFGFSDRTAMNSRAVAELWVKLMKDVLGYETFLAAGGDVGGPITKALALYHADVVRGVHMTDVGWPTGQEDFASLTTVEQAFMQESQQWVMTEGAYLFVQGNKPQSLAYALNDSPVGLAAWIVSFANGGKQESFADEAFGGRDELLTNVMIYWFTETAGSAARSYREEMRMAYAPVPKRSGKSAPTAIAIYPRDLIFPQEWAKRQGLAVQRYTIMPEGGHFAALEIPEIYAKDLEESFAQLVH